MSWGRDCSLPFTDKAQRSQVAYVESQSFDLVENQFWFHSWNLLARAWAWAWATFRIRFSQICSPFEVEVMWLFPGYSQKGLYGNSTLHRNTPSGYFLSLAFSSGLLMCVCMYRFDCLPCLWLHLFRKRTCFVLGPLWEAAFLGLAWRIKLPNNIFLLLPVCDLWWKSQE